jgi:hypothetical protein
MDEANGSGWLELNGDGEVEGLIGFHMGVAKPCRRLIALRFRQKELVNRAT